MRRPILIVLLSLGAFFGFTSGIAHLSSGSSHWGRCGGHGRWSQYDEPAPVAAPTVAAPTVQAPAQPAPTIVVQPPAPAAPVYPQVIIIPQGGTQVPAPATTPAAPETPSK